MGTIVLKDGRVLNLSTEQQNRLGMVILYANDLGKKIKVGTEMFRISDIVTDPKEINKLTQVSFVDVPTVKKSKKNMENP